LPQCWYTAKDGKNQNTGGYKMVPLKINLATHGCAKTEQLQQLVILL